MENSSVKLPFENRRFCVVLITDQWCNGKTHDSLRTMWELPLQRQPNSYDDWQKYNKENSVNGKYERQPTAVVALTSFTIPAPFYGSDGYSRACRLAACLTRRGR